MTRWGIVGTGVIAGLFAATLARLPASILVGVASRNTERARTFARNHGFRQVHTVTNAGALATLEDVDVVYIATPNHCHRADTLAVISAGKPVICEKPLATSATDAISIAEAARGAEVFCMEGLWSLCLPIYKEVTEMIRNGAIGKLHEITASFGIPESESNNSKLFDPARGGGALLDRGVYPLALAARLSGPLSLLHVTGELNANGVDVAARLSLTSASGVTVTISVALDRLCANTLVASGSTGRISLQEPITAPPAYRLKHHPARSEGSDSGHWRFRIKDWLKTMPIAYRVRHALDRGVRWLPSGLEAEILEVEQALANAQANPPQSRAPIPLEDSIAVLTLVDEARAKLVGSRESV